MRIDTIGGKSVLGIGLAAATFIVASPARAEPAPKAQSDALAAALREDSRTWIINRLDANSIQPAQIVSRSGDQMTIRSAYTQNGGRPGWIQGRFTGGRLSCIEFHDAGGNCRQVITYDQVHGSQARDASGIRYSPFTDSTGSRACLQIGNDQGSATTYRDRDGYHVRTDRHTEVKVIRNTCNRALSYDLNVGSTNAWGGSRPTRFNIGPSETHRYTCYLATGQTALGTEITVQTSCSRQ